MLTVEVRINNETIVRAKAVRLGPLNPVMGESCKYAVTCHKPSMTVMVTSPFDTDTGAEQLAINVLKAVIKKKRE